MKPYIIYGLVNSWTGQCIYVGQTHQSLSKRLIQTRSRWKKNTDDRAKHFAIMGVYALGGTLIIIELDRAADQDEADRFEILWIDKMKKAGYAWGNVAAGGPGNHGVKRGRAQRQRIARSVRAYRQRERMCKLLLSNLQSIHKGASQK